MVGAAVLACVKALVFLWELATNWAYRWASPDHLPS